MSHEVDPSKKNLALAPVTSNSKINVRALAQHKSNSGCDCSIVCCGEEKTLKQVLLWGSLLLLHNLMIPKKILQLFH